MQVFGGSPAPPAGDKPTAASLIIIAFDDETLYMNECAVYYCIILQYNILYEPLELFVVLIKTNLWLKFGRIHHLPVRFSLKILYVAIKQCKISFYCELCKYPFPIWKLSGAKFPLFSSFLIVQPRQPACIDFLMLFFLFLLSTLCYVFKSTAGCE